MKQLEDFLSDATRSFRGFEREPVVRALVEKRNGGLFV